MSNKFKFTNANIKNLKPQNKRVYIYDTEEKGLSLLLTPSGNKSYYLRGRVLRNQIRVKLGEPSFMSVDEARNEARKTKIMLNSGKNPIAEKKKLNQEDSFKVMYEKFIEEKEQHLKPRTIDGYKGLWKNYLNVLGNKKISQLTTDDFKKLHKKITNNNGKRCANHSIVFSKTIFNYFIKGNLYDGKNPVIPVQLNKESPRIRYLTKKEMEKFVEVINNYPDSISKDAIWLLLMTGARRSNVFSMRWQDVDLESKTWVIPETKTGKNMSVALVDSAVEILKRLAETKYNEYVFFSTESKTGHITEVRSTWKSILTKAEITNLHLHDLRHTLATYMVSYGANAFQVKRALTHSSIQSTQIYVNLDVEQLRETLNDTVKKMIG